MIKEKGNKYLVLMPHDVTEVSDLDRYIMAKALKSSIGEPNYWLNEYMSEFNFIIEVFKKEYGLNLLYNDELEDTILSHYKVENIKTVKYHLRQKDISNYSATLIQNSKCSGTMLGTYSDAMRDRHRTKNKHPHAMNMVLSGSVPNLYMPHFYIDQFISNPILRSLVDIEDSARYHIDKIPLYKEGYARNLIYDAVLNSKKIIDGILGIM